GRYLLDTSIIIALFASDASVKENLAKAEETFVPVIAIGELCYGAHKSARGEENLRRIDEFAANSVVVGCDTSTAHHYGQVKNALRIKGRPIPENDIWIAAIALQHNLALVTRDEHFKEIEGLKVIVW
ncbi:MAG: type II toxin-antitoxin system VapC family toxin, partial [Anaerolineae bacterium]|nr:type II toxin-antitoxin system VapC family toxin [Anaerolineae bacterium]